MSVALISKWTGTGKAKNVGHWSRNILLHCTTVYFLQGRQTIARRDAKAVVRQIVLSQT